MLDSDFWRDLAERFRRLDPDGILQAGWTLPFGHLSSELWEIFSTGDLGPSIRAQFEPLAIRAGLKLDAESAYPVHPWLNALKAYGPQIELIGPAGVVFQESGFIKRLCQISADFCNVLESRALETEHAFDTGIQILPRQFESPIEFKSLVPPSEALVTPEVMPAPSQIAHEPEILPANSEKPPGPELLPTGSETPPKPELLPTIPEVSHQPQVTAPISEVLPQPEVSSSSIPNSASLREERRQWVAAFLRDCNKISDVRIMRQHIWLSVGHSNAHQFEYWQGGDSKATDQDNRNFTRILQTPPDQFIAMLKNKGHLK